MNAPLPHPLALEYRVPRQFSVSSFLLMVSLLGVLFGVLRMLRQPDSLFLFLGAQWLLVCVAQVRFNQFPRWASMVVGGVFVPAWILAFALTGQRQFGLDPQEALVRLPLAILAGGLVGYCLGTVAAGIFLVQEVMRRGMQRLFPRSVPPPSPI